MLLLSLRCSRTVALRFGLYALCASLNALLAFRKLASERVRFLVRARSV